MPLCAAQNVLKGLTKSLKEAVLLHVYVFSSQKGANTHTEGQLQRQGKLVVLRHGFRCGIAVYKSPLTSCM